MIILKNLCVIYIFYKLCKAQEPTVTLRQGVLIGVQIYPENYPGPIHAYMGIPYAAPPIGVRRFSPPERHTGWNKTLFAANMPPNCPHSLHPQHADTQNEDCLFLNIWTPIISERYSKLPVVIFLDGNNFADINPLHPITGQDLAAEGLVVVTVNYRLNVFGFFCLGNGEARGNMGILDQYMALLWVNENIDKFGGDRHSITLMGYSAGATSVTYHLTSPRTRDLFSKVIIMSGSMSLLPSSYLDIVNNSLLIAKRVGCRIDDYHLTLQCLRNISTQELLASFDERYSEHNAYVPILGPVVDSFLSPNDQYLTLDPLVALKQGKFWNIPVLMGLNNLEVVQDIWLEIREKGYDELYKYINASLKILLQIYGGANFKEEDRLLLSELIKWQYLDRAKVGDATALLEQIQKLYSHVMYDAAIFRQIKLMSITTQPIFVYRFIYSDTLDLNRYSFNFSGSIHGNDLPFLFGPTLFQQITRRRGRQIEKRLMALMKNLWANFIKVGNPMPGRTFDVWKTFNEDMFIQNIGDQFSTNLLGDRYFDTKTYLHQISFWSDFLPILGEKLPQLISNSLKNLDSTNSVYRHATYTLTGLVIALLILLFVCIALIKQRAKERYRNAEF